MSSPPATEISPLSHRHRAASLKRRHLTMNHAAPSLPALHIQPATPHVATENGTNGKTVASHASGKKLRRRTRRPSPRTSADRSPAARVEVSAGESLALELHVGSHLLVSGVWQSRVTIDGQELSPQSPWEASCELRNNDADYWEFEMCLGEPWSLQRQIMFARNERFVWIADTILSAAAAATIEYSGSLPLPAGITFAPGEETHEGWLAGRRPFGLVLPMALPEWRTDGAPGSLETTPFGLRLKQVAHGRALHAPLLIDLHPRRCRKPCTWRRLTIAESMQIVPRDGAASFRVQSGRDQWLFYRSLLTQGNRTVLGKNLCSDFLAAKIQPDGRCDAIVEIG